MSAPTAAGARFAPPREAESILRFALSRDDRAAVLGDLEEGFRLRLDEASPAAARRWYRGQVVRSIWPALSLHADARGIGRLFGALIVGIAALWIVGDALLIGSRLGYAALFPHDPGPELVLRLTYLGSMIPGCAVAGMLAFRTGGDVGRLAALSLGALLTVPVLIAPFLSHGSEPLWARLIWLASAPTATVLGSAVAEPRAGKRP